MPDMMPNTTGFNITDIVQFQLPATTIDFIKSGVLLIMYIIVFALPIISIIQWYFLRKDIEETKDARQSCYNESHKISDFKDFAEKRINAIETAQNTLKSSIKNYDKPITDLEARINDIKPPDLTPLATQEQVKTEIGKIVSQLKQTLANFDQRIAKLETKKQKIGKLDDIKLE